MKAKVITLTIVVLLVFLVLKDPEKSAAIVRSILETLTDWAEALSTFLFRLF